MQETQEMQLLFLGWEDPPCRRACNPLQYSCLENPTDRGAWGLGRGFTLWGCKDLDMTEVTESACLHTYVWKTLDNLWFC